MRVQKTFPSVMRGVSEQAPERRLEGQHGVQDNMISDPVHGLTRRHGSVLLDELYVGSATTIGATATTMAQSMREMSYTFGGEDFSVLARAAQNLSGHSIPAFQVFNKTTSQFIPTVEGSVGGALAACKNSGVSAVVAIGRYVLFAANGFIPVYTSTDAFASTNKYSVTWVETGQYSTKYTLGTLRLSDGFITYYDYTTPTAAYPGVLDTSDILAADPEYTKKVTDRTNAYTTAVTQWIGTSAAAIVPNEIATQLVALVPGTDPTVFQSGAFIGGVDGVSNTVVVKENSPNTLRIVYNTVAAPGDLTAFHVHNKIVRIQPQEYNTTDVYYLKGVPKTPGYGEFHVDALWGEVIWRETAGVITQPVDVFCIGTVLGGQFYVARSPTELASMTGLDVPQYSPSAVGDQTSAPVPTFLRNGINYLGLMQDRLLIGSGNTVFASRPGDYFNWFRQSVLTVLDTDPIEIAANGSEEDTIRSSVTFDKNLILFGDKLQYILLGSGVMSPKTTVLNILSRYTGITDAPPTVAGDLVFYASEQLQTNLHQMQPGELSDAPYTVGVSQQLDRYISGTPIELRSVTEPNFVLFRTSGLNNGIYVYTYLDSNNQRVFDSWSRWTWHTDLGICAGMSIHSGSVIVYTIRASSTGTWLCADLFTVAGDTSTRPFLDSQRTASSVLSGLSWAPADTAAALSGSLVYDNSTDMFLLGTSMEQADAVIPSWRAEPAGLVVGWDYPAEVALTNPFMRSREGDPKLSGRLTLTRYLISVLNTGGMLATVVTPNGLQATVENSGSILGTPSSTLGEQPISSGIISIPVGYEVRECTVTLKAKEWLPLTVTSVGWIGQHFLR